MPSGLNRTYVAVGSACVETELPKERPVENSVENYEL